MAFLRDLRFAVQSLRRSPGLIVVAVVTLGLGIGANTAMFSVLNGYVLRPSPYRDSERLSRIYRSTPQDPRGGIPPADYLDLKAEMSGYGEIAAYAGAELSLSEPGKAPETTEGLRVSANLLPTLGATPRLGRGFRPDEEIRGNHRVLILSDRCWKNRFGADPHVIGRTVRVDGEPHEIVGVLAEDFSDWRHLSWVDVFRPLGLYEGEARDRNSGWLRLVGRRSPNVTRDEADAFVAGFGRRMAVDFPAANADSSWRSVPIADTWIDRDGRNVLAMLVGLSGFVLLIACSNLANLLLARTMARAREFAVRSALGASRSQVLRPLVAESLLLALSGGVFAIVVALWTFDWMAVASAGDSGVGIDLTLDWHVLGWAFLACLSTALAFGAAPALFASRLDPNATLKSGARGSTGDRGHRRFRQALIVGQFALAMVLLAGAALFVRGLHELNNDRHGWESDDLVTGSILLPAGAYPGPERIADFHRLALERLEALPGVASASFSHAMPFFGLSESRRLLVEGREAPQPGQEPAAAFNAVSPHYFETVGTRLLAGRAFGAGDTQDSAKVFIVNQAMARGLFGGENPLGRRVAQAVGTRVEWGEIVGVVADVRSVYPDRETVVYQLYLPLSQEAWPYSELAVRTARVPPATLVDAIRTTLAALDADLPVRRLQPARTTIVRANYQLGVLATVLTSLAVLGLGLASLGVYGVVARTMAQRSGEFGIRLALGAQVGDITRLVLASGAKLALIGAAIGLFGAFGVTRLIGAVFPAVPTDSVSALAGATLLLVTLALLACYVPARRAARISPTEALRAE